MNDNKIIIKINYNCCKLSLSAGQKLKRKKKKQPGKIDCERRGKGATSKTEFCPCWSTVNNTVTICNPRVGCCKCLCLSVYYVACSYVQMPNLWPDPAIKFHQYTGACIWEEICLQCGNKSCKWIKFYFLFLVYRSG